MRGPNKPKSLHTPLLEGSQPDTAVGQKTRKRASTMPSAPHRSSQIWGHQKNEQQEHGIATPTSPASESSAGSLAYPPASESEALPMTPPQCSLDGRHLSVPVVGFSAPKRVLVQDFQTAAHRRAQACVSESSSSGHDDPRCSIYKGRANWRFRTGHLHDVKVTFGRTSSEVHSVFSRSVVYMLLFLNVTPVLSRLTLLLSDIRTVSRTTTRHVLQLDYIFLSVTWTQYRANSKSQFHNIATLNFARR
jgi:hypothetical protein